MEIQFGTGWNCCAENPTRVIVFDNGAKWAVCRSCASTYAGSVETLPDELRRDWMAIKDKALPFVRAASRMIGESE